MKMIQTLGLSLTGLALSTSIAIADSQVVRIASHVSEFSPLHAQSELFAAEIEKRLPGQFEFKLFPSGQLGKEKDLMTNVQAGSLEMINVASGVMKLDKKLGVFDMPWLFTDRDHVQRAMKAVAKHLSLTSHVYTPSFLLASEAFFNALTPEQQKVFSEVGREITDSAYATSAELEKKYFEEMKSKMSINDVDLPKFQKATQSAYAKYIESEGDEYLKIINGAKMQ